jgi:DNA-binding MarR family transcriptional regulator
MRARIRQVITRVKAKARRSPQSTERRYSTVLEVLMQFRVVVRSMRRHYQSVERLCGVTGAQLWAMAQIDAVPNMTVGQLARDLAIHQSTASNIVAALQDAGLVTRERPNHDQRVVRLALTAAGRRVMRRAPRPLRGALQEALLSLPPARLASLNRDLAAVLAHLEGSHGRVAKDLLSELLGDR